MKLRRSAGLTILELLVTISLIMIMVGFASFNYMKIVDEQKQGKAQNEAKEFVKALKTWENKKGVPVRQYVSLTGQPQVLCPSCGRIVDTDLQCKYCKGNLPVRKFTLTDLATENIIKSPPDDPWSVQYDIDTTKGIVFSYGPDSQPDTADDIPVQFRPRFEMLRASQDAVANQVIIQFSRAVDRTTISSAVLTLTSGGAVDVTTYSLDLSDPYRLKAHLSKTWPANTNFVVKAASTPPNAIIKARDGTEIDLTHISVVSTAADNGTT